jgi:hypothetical protein
MYHVRIEGTRIKHTMGKSSIKMYDKFGKVSRLIKRVRSINKCN